MSKRQRLRKARKVAAREEALRQWHAKKRLYRVAFPWKQVAWLVGGLVLVAALVILVPKGIIWLADWGRLSGPFGTIARTELIENQFATLVTSQGDIKLKLMIDSAPRTAANFVVLVRSDFYDGVKFHRVIEDFMMQTGDPLSRDDDASDDGTGGPGYELEDEFTNQTPKLVRGIVAMANSGQPDTNGSQFFIITKEATPWLDGLHTPFARVVEGMAVVDKIDKVRTDDSDRPNQDIVINDIILTDE